MYASESTPLPGFRLSGYPAQPMRTVPPVAVPPPLAAGPSLSSALGDDAGVVQAAKSSVRLARIGKEERVRRIGIGASRLEPARRSPGRDSR